LAAAEQVGLQRPQARRKPAGQSPRPGWLQAPHRLEPRLAEEPPQVAPLRVEVQARAAS